MQSIESLISTLSGWVWGPPMLILLVGTGVYLTFLLRGLQFRALGHAFRLILEKDHGHEGDISHFGALMTALAATVGMATKYAEAVLAQKYRERGDFGMRGGPMYYLAKGANLPVLAWLFALFTALATFGIGNMTQANAVAGIFHSTFSIEPWMTGVVLTLLTGVVILGGIRSIANFTSFLVPFMILCYVIAAGVVLALNASEIPGALSLIFYHAFNPIAAGGGFAGAAVAAAIRYGVARGVFSNESGLGSAPIAAAAARTKDPVKQALVSMTQTFIDTLVVCSMTALVILTATPWTQGVGAASLTSQSFAETLGHTGELIVAIATALFAFSTILGWSYYGEKAIEYLANSLGGRGAVRHAIHGYRLVFTSVVVVGAMMQLYFVWNFSDLANGLMAIPNLIALLLLSKVIKQETDRYFNTLK